jgi:outer membrane protein OmpA-like peptidoglycan-associated protein
MEGINFVTDSAELTPQAKDSLDTVLDALLRLPDTAVKIMAHTDNRGRAEYNLDLSRRRAISVVRYLQSKGIERSRLLPQAFGESMPIAPNATAEGRFRNRRVEFETFSRP